ncbi:universal stress protein [Fodinicola acaciae]|uniref:universal stress protein n=1 Tax=Fodinicola acaciae TaxID=2681555 RepID=UPI0013D75FAF|nr:universal stress protein [Fodinicola acaciae]
MISRDSSTTTAIVVGVDPDANPWGAVRWAATEAADRGLRLRLVHLVDTVRAADDLADFPSGQAAFHAGGRFLESAQAHAAFVAPGVEVSWELLRADDTVAIGQVAADAYFVVTGTADAEPRPDVFGATGYALFRHGRCVVVAVPGLPHLDRRTSSPIALVFAGAHGTATTENMIGFAFEEADVRGAPILAVSTGPDPGRAEIFQRWRAKFPDLPVLSRSVKDAAHLLDAIGDAQLVVIGCHDGEGNDGFDSQSFVRRAAGAIDAPFAVVRSCSDLT